MTPLGFWLLLAGPLWAAVGATALPRRYRARALDTRQVPLAGGLWGACLGPLAVGYLYGATPVLARASRAWVPSIVLLAELALLFAWRYPQNPCLTNTPYVMNQLQMGLIVGSVYATVAAGLTLIFSVQRIINFAHGQFVMLGGVLSYLLLTQLWNVNPLVAIPLIGLVSLALGMLAEIVLLQPIHRGLIERPGEYAILITFGLGIFLQYALVGLLGSPSGIRAPRYTDHALLGIDESVLRFGSMHVRTDLLIAGIVGLVIFVALTWFLQRTWTGKSFRAVAMNREAAAVAGIPSGHTFTLAFGIGTMLAGMAGAALVPALNFPVPEMATRIAIRSYVIVVLGGLGSVPGALLGGLFLGAMEALTAACHPDPSRGAAYQVAAGLLLFAMVLLVRPQGFFGSKA